MHLLLLSRSLIKHFGCPCLKVKFLAKPITKLALCNTQLYVSFSVNFDTLNAVLGIYSIYFGDVTNFTPETCM